MTAPAIELVERPILFAGRLVRAIQRRQKWQTRRLARNLTLIPRHKVTADPMPGQTVDQLVAIAPPYRYRARIGDAGAISAELGGGLALGVKPGEFDLVCPYADGRTYLDAGRWRIDVQPHQRLWVRETWSKDARTVIPCPPIWYRADFSDEDDPARGEHIRGCDAERGGRGSAECFACWSGGRFRWRPSIHMERRDARLVLLVTAVRLERLQTITEADAQAEGVARPTCPHPDCTPGGCASSRYVPEFARLWDTINAKRGPWAANPWVWVVEFQVVLR